MLNAPGPEYLHELREGLTSFCDGCAILRAEQGFEPTPPSQAAAEFTAFPRPESLITVRALATILINLGGEHVTAFVKTATDPITACWTCVRSMLESCAIAAWLLDPTIDVQTRVGRGFALRYEGLEQQVKFARAAGLNEELRVGEARINAVERDAIDLGYAPVLDRNGDRAGIGQRMPSATDVISQMLDAEVMYRLLSAVAHGHSWAISKLSYQEAAGEALELGGVSVTLLEKAVSTTGMAILGLLAAKAWSKPLLYQFRYCGWDEARLVELLESVFDKLCARPEVRFWRS